jgi:uncharacterized membrane protein
LQPERAARSPCLFPQSSPFTEDQVRFAVSCAAKAVLSAYTPVIDVAILNGRPPRVPETPILPAHIEETIQAIARLHAAHHHESGPIHRWLDRMTDWLGRPRFIAIMSLLVALWGAGNLIALARGAQAWDVPPFGWLQTVLGSMAFFVALIILATQRRADRLAEYREQLTLELAILSEQKSAKIIALLEEMRRDNPMLRKRVDEEAEAMAVAADPQAVLDAIKESHGTLLSELDAPEIAAI